MKKVILAALIASSFASASAMARPVDLPSEGVVGGLVPDTGISGELPSWGKPEIPSEGVEGGLIPDTGTNGELPSWGKPEVPSEGVEGGLIPDAGVNGELPSWGKPEVPGGGVDGGLIPDTGVSGELPSWGNPSEEEGQTPDMTNPSEGVPERPFPEAPTVTPEEDQLPDMNQPGDATPVLDGLQTGIELVNDKIDQVGTASMANDVALGNALANQGQKIESLFGEVGRLDDRIDGMAAMNQAVNAARPYLHEGQTGAVGAGVGLSGGSTAISVGVAARINQSWTANANVATTTGSYNDFSMGVGASYGW